METHSHRPVVLVVEDDAITRLDAVGMIEEAGYTAIEAQDASEAMQQLISHQEIEVVFTDIDMPPGANGLELASHVHLQRPDIGLILTSGHNSPTPSQIPDRGTFIAKPYAARSIVALIAGQAASRRIL